MYKDEYQVASNKIRLRSDFFAASRLCEQKEERLLSDTEFGFCTKYEVPGTK